MAYIIDGVHNRWCSQNIDKIKWDLGLQIDEVHEKVSKAYSMLGVIKRNICQFI